MGRPIHVFMTAALITACTAPSGESGPPDMTVPGTADTGPSSDGSAPDAVNEQFGSLAHLSRSSMAVGTHRPEILTTTDGRIFIIVVEHGDASDPNGAVRHRGYELDSALKPIGASFVVSRETAEFGAPADHRAAIVGDEIVVVYQSNVMKAGCQTSGPAEECTESQSLLLARFSRAGQEILRTPIVAKATDPNQDNFPDHCLAWRDQKSILLVSTGTRGNTMKIREVQLDGQIAQTHEYTAGDSGIGSVIGNSMVVDGDGVIFFSATGPGDTAQIEAVRLDASLQLVASYAYYSADLEQNFPTGAALLGDKILVANIGRPRGGAVSIEANPYYPYLKLLDRQSMTLVSNTAIGDGSPGFAHVHPTITRVGSRVLVAWSKRVSQNGSTAPSAPQVVIEEFVAK
jgi:hypothetical protein